MHCSRTQELEHLALPVLLICLMQPTLRLAVPFVERANADLERHRMVGPRRLETTNGWACLQAQIQNYASVRTGLYSGEASAPRGESYHAPARRNDDLASGFDGI